jgi:hypothetical protein
MFKYSIDRIHHVTYVYCSASEKVNVKSRMSSKETKKTIWSRECGAFEKYNASQWWAATGQGLHLQMTTVDQDYN